MTEYDLAFWGDKITAVGVVIFIVALIFWAPFWIWAGLGVTTVGLLIWHPSWLSPPWF